MTQNKQSQSAPVLSDPLPRTYACFCNKIYTTYPGIYLHLKSKHTPLFEKYKKVKITKLFKKINDEEGNSIYRLEQLSEDNSNINKEDLTFLKQVKREQVVQDSNCIFKTKKNNSLHYKPATRRKMTNASTTLQFQGNNFGYQMQHRYLANPFNNMPMGMGFPPFNPLFQSYQPVFPELRITTKKIMQNYLQLLQSNFKLQAKKYLYNLMVYIDKNCEMIKDERIKNRVFLSYCCDFDSQFIAPLVLSYLQLLQTEKNNASQAIQANTHNVEVSCIKGFIQLLRIKGLTNFQKQQNLGNQTNLRSEQKQKMQVLIEWQEQNQQYQFDLKQ